MPRQVITDTFEALGGMAKASARDAAPATAGPPQPPAGGEPTLLPQVAADEKTRLLTVRQNLARINQEIVEAKKKREQKYEQNKRIQQTEQSKQIKKVEEKKKESVLMKFIKGKQGTKEGILRASG